jgi:hypothetical protein
MPRVNSHRTYVLSGAGVPPAVFLPLTLDNDPSGILASQPIPRYAHFVRYLAIVNLAFSVVVAQEFSASKPQE